MSPQLDAANNSAAPVRLVPMDRRRMGDLLRRVNWKSFRALQVSEVDGGALVALVDKWGLPGRYETMGTAWIDEHSVVVGMGSGAIYRVTLE